MKEFYYCKTGQLWLSEAFNLAHQGQNVVLLGSFFDECTL